MERNLTEAFNKFIGRPVPIKEYEFQGVGKRLMFDFESDLFKELIQTCEENNVGICVTPPGVKEADRKPVTVTLHVEKAGNGSYYIGPKIDYTP